MITYKTISHGLLEGRQEIESTDTAALYTKLISKTGPYGNQPTFLFESKDVSDVYGRLSLMGCDPILKLTGKDESFSVELLKPRGRQFFDLIAKSDELAEFTESYQASNDKLTGTIPQAEHVNDEQTRSQQINIAQLIRTIIQKTQLQHRCHLGLYGAFSYDFVRLFEPVENKLPNNEINDFTLFLFDTFIFVDHLRNNAELVVYRDSTQAVEEASQIITNQINQQQITADYQFSAKNAEFLYSQKEYEDMVESARELAKQGELFEVVFANTLKADFSGSALGLYLKYRDINPSPYLFYFDFGDEQLVGASPEMMVRVENRRAHLRPISGTAKRGADPVADHENMVALLNCEKERAELDMLIDLGRNDLSRVCKPGLQIKDYRFVEKYSRVMHTVSHVSGELRDDMLAFDALIVSLNAGTLTGAPKVAAMNAIEEHESERRGYYGGAVGYLTFADELNTGIIIRTAHIRDGKLRFAAGATLLYDSDPSSEYHETICKAQAFLDTIM